MGQELAKALPEGITEPADRDTPVMLLSQEDRKKLLGKLAEFELKLLELPPGRQSFVLAYLMDPSNISAAVRKAGYSDKRAAATANTFMSNPDILACIALGEQLREDRTRVTSDRTLHELAIIAFSDITHFEFVGGRVTTCAGVPSYATRAISSVEFTETEYEDDKGKQRFIRKTKIRLWPKDAALKMLAVYQRLLSSEGVTINQDNRSVHVHNYQPQTWVFGEHKLTF